jgi:hypothetical protein
MPCRDFRLTGSHFGRIGSPETFTVTSESSSSSFSSEGLSWSSGTLSVAIYQGQIDKDIQVITLTSTLEKFSKDLSSLIQPFAVFTGRMQKAVFFIHTISLNARREI